jgi:NMT1-like family
LRQKLVSLGLFTLVTAIEERALRSEGNGPLPRSGLQTEFVERTLGKNASADSSTKDGIEVFRLCAFTPPDSLLDRHRVVVFSSEHEQDRNVFGIIALTDCSSIVMAHEVELFKKYGIESTISKEASWAVICDRLTLGKRL